MINTLPQRFWLITSFFTLISFALLPLSFSSRLNLLRQKGLACAWYAGQNRYTRIQPVRRTSGRQQNKDEWGGKKAIFIYSQVRRAIQGQTVCLISTKDIFRSSNTTSSHKCNYYWSSHYMYNFTCTPMPCRFLDLDWSDNFLTQHDSDSSTGCGGIY